MRGIEGGGGGGGRYRRHVSDRDREGERDARRNAGQLECPSAELYDGSEKRLIGLGVPKMLVIKCCKKNKRITLVQNT